MHFLRYISALLLLSLGLCAAEEASPAQKELQSIITRQQLLLAKAAAEEGKGLDVEGLKTKVQDIVYEYEGYIKKHPDVAAGYVAYGALLDKIEMRREATVMYLRANKLDSDIPFVKNQLGNHLAEDGKPLLAANYFIAAIKLDPKEPLYHYQLGTLLTEARDEFLTSGEWTKSSVEHAMQEAFRRAAELAPNRIEFTYRYCESFYDLEKPDWDAALKAWAALELKLRPGVEQQTVRLHQANILIKQNKMDQARIILATVDAGSLMTQKEKLIAQLPENAKK
jgi:tetratricopeptide (TPR) repeat protein